MTIGEGNFAKKIGEKLFRKREIVSETEVVTRTEMIKGIAKIIEEEKDRADKDYQRAKDLYPESLKEHGKKVNLVREAEENLWKGKLSNKKLIQLVEDNFGAKLMGLDVRTTPIIRPDRLDEPSKQEMDELTEIRNEMWNLRNKEKDWIKRMKSGKISPEEVAEVLGKKEGKTEKVEK